MPTIHVRRVARGAAMVAVAVGLTATTSGATTEARWTAPVQGPKGETFHVRYGALPLAMSLFTNDGVAELSQLGSADGAASPPSELDAIAASAVRDAFQRVCPSTDFGVFRHQLASGDRTLVVTAVQSFGGEVVHELKAAGHLDLLPELSRRFPAFMVAAPPDRPLDEAEAAAVETWTAFTVTALRTDGTRPIPQVGPDPSCLIDLEEVPS